MRLAPLAFLGFVGFTALAIAACDDPAKGKTKAQTGEALPTTQQNLTGASTFVFDNESSKIEWTGAKVTGKHDGGFKTFRGEVKLVDGTPEKSGVTVDIDANSLFTDSEKLAGHLKS